jgi:hypothetical protein
MKSINGSEAASDPSAMPIHVSDGVRPQPAKDVKDVSGFWSLAPYHLASERVGDVRSRWRRELVD